MNYPHRSIASLFRVRRAALAAVVAAVATAFAAPAASAAILINDAFTGSAGALHGRTPSPVHNGNAWSSTGGNTGSLSLNGTGGVNALTNSSTYTPGRSLSI